MEKTEDNLRDENTKLKAKIARKKKKLGDTR